MIIVFSANLKKRSRRLNQKFDLEVLSPMIMGNIITSQATSAGNTIKVIKKISKQ